MKTINIFFIIVVGLFFVDKLNAQNYTFSGYIAKDTTWTADTLDITGDVIIDSNVTLIISPGTFIHIIDYYSIQSYGTIRAIGTETDSIVFTHLDTIYHNDTSTIAGGWHGIRLMPRTSNDTSIFKYCKITNGKSVVPGSWYSYEDPKNNGGNLYCYNFGSLIIEHCFIGNGIVKRDGAGLYCKYGKYVSIQNNHFYSNHGFNLGGGIYAYGIDSLFIDNNLLNYNTSYQLIYNFEGGSGAGILASYALGDSAFAYICNNKIFNNKGVTGGIYDAYVHSNISNNLICNNYGIGLWNAHYYNSPTYINNTIVNNWASYVSGVELLSDNVTLINNIIWNNRSTFPGNPQIHFNHNENPIVTNCNVMGGYEGEGNIDDEPLFINPTLDVGLNYNALDADWSLLDNSPCINTGSPDTAGLYLPDFDINGNQRVYGNRIDMGAYENQYIWVKINDSQVSEDSIKIYPNPGSNKIFIELQPEMEGAWFELIDGVGNRLIQSKITTIPALFSPNVLKPGIYFYRIHNHQKIIKTGKWIKI